MTRYFKRYIGSNKEVEINKAKALNHIGRIYKHPNMVLRCLPLGYAIRVGWTFYKKAKTK